MTEHRDMSYHLVVRKLIPLCALDDSIQYQHSAIGLTREREKERAEGVGLAAIARKGRGWNLQLDGHYNIVHKVHNYF